MENDPELITLTAGEIMDPAIATSLRHATAKGWVLYHTFVNDKIETCEKVLILIPRLNLYTFQKAVDLNKKRGQAISAKKSSAMATLFHINLKDWPESDVNMANDFFKHESVRDSPTFSKNGAAVLQCLPNIPKPGKNLLKQRATAALLDMAAVVHMVKPTTTRTFKAYFLKNLFQFMESQLTPTCERLDAV